MALVSIEASCKVSKKLSPSVSSFFVYILITETPIPITITAQAAMMAIVENLVSKNVRSKTKAQTTWKFVNKLMNELEPC